GQLADPVSEWPTVTNAVVLRTPSGDFSQVSVTLDETVKTNRFFALQMMLDEAGSSLDPLDGDGRWSLYSNAHFTTDSESILPASGFEFLRHYRTGAWNHSAAVRDIGILLEVGTYVISVDVGHDGSSLPFADGYVNIGFAEDVAGVTHAVEVRDAITLFDAIPGVTRSVISNAVPVAGWERWEIQVEIVAKSPAIGKTVYLGIHAQSGSTGSQALFDRVQIEKQSAEDEDWTLFNNAQSLSESGWLTPVEGNRFLHHSVGANWSHSAMVKESGLTLQPGTYVITLDAGYDANSSRPFAAENSINLGFIDATAALADAYDVKDQLSLFKGLSGVAVSETRAPTVNGWVPWRIEISVDAGSSAVGQSVFFAIHAQSKLDPNQANFDHLRIIEPPAEAIVVQADQDVAWINKEMFGANLVYHTEQLDAAFASAFNACGMELLRYPGGTICEQEFDYLDSDGPDDDRPSLSETVEFCITNGTELILVVPTKRFLTNIPAGVQYAKDFVKAVNIDKDFGDIHVKYWELGNEYYADPAGAEEITADEYKVIADQFAAGMVQADPTIVPVVQFRRTELVEAQTISDYLAASTNNGSVRASLTHVYPGNNFFEMRDNVPSQLSTGKQIFGLDDLLVTEWNVASGSGLTGMKQANALSLLFESLAKGGATHTTLWPLNWQFNGVGTVLSDVDTGALRPPGQAFAELARQVKESTLVQTEIGSDAFHVSAYRDASQALTLFVMCYELPASTSMKIHVNGFAFSRVEAERLSKADELARGAATWFEAYTVQDGNDIYVEANQMNDWEIIRLTIYP
ncbi:MAG: hypothetical protein U9P12_02115, partial [Verrucomicrobiota bacterium]|nr:hypothetical protein [Verrucomicrobiota bacterium]